MGVEGIREVLERVAAGELSPEDGAAALDGTPIFGREDLRLDLRRQDRTGQPEIVYGPGKSAQQVLAAVRGLMAADVRPILVTRATPEQTRSVRGEFPGTVVHERASLLVVSAAPGPARGTVAVVGAGTSDLPVAEEAARAAEAFALDVDLIVDVGVAGIHRVMREVPRLEAAGCVIVVAGMEGALASVVAGLVTTPVIAVPTSVGYGASFGGLAALLAMLSSCVPGVVTVNVDNGLGAAMAAHRILTA